MDVSGIVKRAWIPLVLSVVFAVSALAVVRLHAILGSEDLNGASDAGSEIVQFHPKVVTYEVFGPDGSTANINYWDAEANNHQVTAAPLPWTYTITTLLPAMTANIMVQGDGDQIGCRVSVDHVVRDERAFVATQPQIFCLVKSA